MKKFIAAALLAAVAMPVALPAAHAQSQREGRRDRQDVRQDRRDVQRDQRRGNPQQARQERRDQPGSRQEVRGGRGDRDRSWGNNDWQTHRAGNRGAYARGNWRAPFRYNNFRDGSRISAAFFGSRYIISDPWRYHLPRAGWGQTWVRHYDDLLLVDTRRGRVVRVIRNFYW